ncbi:hypothetical protein B0H17DRAFT_1076855 [Mycena rosella]|uniref:Uncharacterized protein n=1 Tax=Mycena rosella TaxID=1033263 RepID=A0AAD7D9I0_MYCRO|nr:hypothetical protein B0H17DRAFT_1076855 [Mycena rosella]
MSDISESSIPGQTSISKGSPASEGDSSEIPRTAIDSGTADAHRPDAAPPALKLTPISPESFQRYTRYRTLTKRRTSYVVPPLSRSFSREPPTQWTAQPHPEGGLYFIHEQQRIHIFTDAYLYDKAIHAQITSAVDQLLAREEMQSLSSTDSGQIDIVLDLMEESPDNDECGYYLVDHSARVIFWLEEFDISTLEIWSFVPGIESPSHAKLCLEVEYWSHCEYFPAAMPITPEMLDELRDIIIYGIGDTMTSATTTQALLTDHLFRMLTLAKEMGEPVTKTDSTVKMRHGSIAVFARFMKEFARERFYNFYGEKTARLNSDESVYGSIAERSYILAWVSPLLFNYPLRHLRTVEVANMDQLIKYASWQKLITALSSEWQDVVLYGTLVLNTNVGFLSIPASAASVPGRVASYASVSFGLGSIILGIMLLSQYRLESPDVPEVTAAAKFFQDHGESAHGLETLSVVLSLPYALMIWALITFILAFLITIFETSSAPMRGVISAIVITVFLAIVGFVWTEKPFMWTHNLGVMRKKIQSTGAWMWSNDLSRRTKQEDEKQGPTFTV